jgi:hypothetical protein
MVNPHLRLLIDRLPHVRPTATKNLDFQQRPNFEEHLDERRSRMQLLRTCFRRIAWARNYKFPMEVATQSCYGVRANKGR